jgi:hypothetical protein
MNLKSTALTGILLASSVLAACGPTYVAYRAPLPPPPAPYVVGTVGYAPGPGYVWVGGFWNLNGGRWAWVNGRWAVPPRPRAVWVADRWVRYGNGWRYYRGYWR